MSVRVWNEPFLLGTVHSDPFRGNSGWTRESDAEEAPAHRSQMPALYSKGLEQTGEVVEDGCWSVFSKLF